MCKEICVSPLPKTWIFDLDGTIVKHNGYKLDGEDSLLDGVKDFFTTMSASDMVVFITSRDEKYKLATEDFLKKNEIRYNHIIYNAPFGERILLNDKKPSGLVTAISINLERDRFLPPSFLVDELL